MTGHRKGRCNKCGKWTHLWPLSADKMYCDECFKDYDWIEASDLYEIRKLEEHELRGGTEEVQEEGKTSSAKV